MLAELENKVRYLNSTVVSKDDRIKWCQETIANLKEELSLSKEEASSMRPKIKNLKEVVDRVKADKIRALDQAEELSGVVTRLKAEVSYFLLQFHTFSINYPLIMMFVGGKNETRWSEATGDLTRGTGIESAEGLGI